MALLVVLAAVVALCWPAMAAHPALADGFLYARNSDTRSNELVCLDLRP